MENYKQRLIEEQFLNIVMQWEENENKVIKRLQEFFNHSPNSENVHFSDFKAANKICENNEIRKYITHLKQEHTNKIFAAIFSDNVTFLKKHFIDWFVSYYKLDEKRYKKQSFTSKMLHKHFYEACTASSNEVVRYFLENENLKNSLKTKIDVTKDNLKAIKIAYSKNNIDLIRLFFQIDKLDINKTLHNLEVDKYYKKLNHSTKVFIKKFKEDRETVNNLKSSYLKNPNKLDIEEFRQVIQNFSLIANPSENINLMTSIAIEACKANNSQVLDYLFNHKEISIKPNLFDSEQRIFLEACHYNSINCLSILLKEYEKQKVFNKGKMQQELNLSEAGLIIATQCNCYEAVEFLCKIPNYLTPMLVTHCIKEASKRQNEKISLLLQKKLNEF